MVNDCPICRRANPPEARYCDCGYDFVMQTSDSERTRAFEAFPRRVTVRSLVRICFIGLVQLLTISVFTVPIILVAIEAPISGGPLEAKDARRALADLAAAQPEAFRHGMSADALHTAPIVQTEIPGVVELGDIRVSLQERTYHFGPFPSFNADQKGPVCRTAVTGAFVRDRSRKWKAELPTKTISMRRGT